MKRYILTVVLLALLPGCQTEPTELTGEIIRGEIEAWWGAKIFEGIVVDESVEVDGTYEVTARMVVCFDTLDAMKYVFKHYRKGWRVWKGPVDEAEKREMKEDMLAIPLYTAKNNIVMSNMKELQRAVQQFASESGRYPANFTVKDYSSSVSELLGPYLKNPYIPGAPGIIMAQGDTSEWFSEYEGKAIYFPLGVDFDGINASGYIIKGSSDRTFLRCVLTSR